MERRVDRLDNPADEVPGAAVYRGHLPQGAWRAPSERVEERSARRVGGQHRRRGGLGGWGQTRWAAFSVLAWRGGTASRDTSAKVPA